MAISYATTTQLSQCLGVKKDIPSWAPGTTPTNEVVGTGDASNKIFYLDQKNVLADSYTIYANAVAMVETTDYVLTKDTGLITLTTAGVTKLTTNDMTAKYSYISIDLSDSYFNTVLARAEKRVDKNTNNTFIDATATNPAYQNTVEYQPSKGKLNRVYYSREYPIIDVSSTLASDITAAATTLDVQSGDGASFPSTGTIVIGSEKITISSISTDELTVVRGVGDSTAAVHSEDDEVHSTVIEVSGTDEGTSPSWTVLAHNSQVDVDDDSGKIFIYRDYIINQVDYSRTLMARQDVANRFRLTYLYGYDTIPVDITRLTILEAKKMLLNDTVNSALIQGRNEFNPTVLTAENQEIKDITNDYKSVKISNT